MKTDYLVTVDFGEIKIEFHISSYSKATDGRFNPMTGEGEPPNAAEFDADEAWFIFNTGNKKQPQETKIKLTGEQLQGFFDDEKLFELMEEVILDYLEDVVGYTGI